nr:MAG TPA: hypothetical protein [Caudoviricetes sp.]
MSNTSAAAQAGEQVDAMAVIGGLTAEVARLTQRAVIAEARVSDLEARLEAFRTAPKESK